MTKKKYILKPGKHQFAPKSPAIHDNENLSDAEAEWYLERYPHIRPLFIIRKPVKSKQKSAESQQPESVKSSSEIGVIKNNS